ncbi:MAG TPA: hypothetical protein VGH28_06695 [Polyangiaceae bacterium]
MRRILFALVASCGACALVTDLSTLSGDGGADAADATVDAPFADSAPDAAAVDAASDAANDACSSVAFVQAIANGEFSPQVTTVAATFPAPSVAGDYVVVGLNYEGACGAVANVTDSLGDTYRLLGSFDSSSSALVLETWGAHVTGAGSDTMTAQLTSACDLRNIKAVELRGIDSALLPPVPSASQKGAGGAPTTSIATNGPALLFAHTGDSIAAIAPGASWTKALIDDWVTLGEYELVDEAGTYPVSFVPEAGEDWAILAVALPACQ